MAQAMEEAFKKEWLAVKGVELPEQGREDRRILLSAIAQGVVRHLKDHAAEALEMTVRTEQDDGNDITSSATIGGWGTVTVEQDDTGGNRVMSEGQPEITNVKTDGLYP